MENWILDGSTGQRHLKQIHGESKQTKQDEGWEGEEGLGAG